MVPGIGKLLTRLLQPQEYPRITPPPRPVRVREMRIKRQLTAGLGGGRQRAQGSAPGFRRAAAKSGDTPKLPTTLRTKLSFCACSSTSDEQNGAKCKLDSAKPKMTR